jgi:hypothetical protein
MRLLKPSSQAMTADELVKAAAERNFESCVVSQVAKRFAQTGSIEFYSRLAMPDAINYL